jgi:hypothetical protein
MPDGPGPSTLEQEHGHAEGPSDEPPGQDQDGGEPQQRADDLDRTVETSRCGQMSHTPSSRRQASQFQKQAAYHPDRGRSHSQCPARREQERRDPFVAAPQRSLGTGQPVQRRSDQRLQRGAAPNFQIRSHRAMGTKTRRAAGQTQAFLEPGVDMPIPQAPCTRADGSAEPKLPSTRTRQAARESHESTRWLMPGNRAIGPRAPESHLELRSALGPRPPPKRQTKHVMAGPAGSGSTAQCAGQRRHGGTLE